MISKLDGMTNGKPCKCIKAIELKNCVIYKVYLNKDVKKIHSKFKTTRFGGIKFCI
jgi:hypothetical protein